MCPKDTEIDRLQASSYEPSLKPVKDGKNEVPRESAPPQNSSTPPGSAGRENFREPAVYFAVLRTIGGRTATGRALPRGEKTTAARREFRAPRGNDRLGQTSASLSDVAGHQFGRQVFRRS